MSIFLLLFFGVCDIITIVRRCFIISISSSNQKNVIFPFIWEPNVIVTNCSDIISFHHHAEMEILYVTDGELCLKTISDTFLLKKGDICFIDGDVIHKTSSLTEHTQYDLLRFEFAKYFAFSNLSLLHSLLTPTVFFNNNNICVLRSNENHTNEFIKHLEELPVEPQNNNAISAFSVTSHIFAIIHLMYKYRISSLLFNDDDYNDFKKILPVLQFIEMHYSENITLELLCQKVNFNKSYLCRIFKQLTKLSIVEYLNLTRIHEAKKLISSPKNTSSISEIASAVGYNSVSYFNKLFKKNEHMSPSEYKKLIYKNI